MRKLRLCRPQVPLAIVWLYRWILFRLMFGAGMIKWRGDKCWRDLTCMIYHYETQPMPNTFSWYFHRLPVPIHKGAVLINHLTELVVPFFYFLPGPLGAAAGAITVVFQLMLVISGNFSWLNWLTIVLCIPCFGDSYFAWMNLVPSGSLEASNLHFGAVMILTTLIVTLSFRPAANLISPNQRMNTNFDAFYLVNTYGAFGSITKLRREIIIEGTSDESAVDGWKEYEFKGKPGDIKRRPPWIAPYHLRLDWLIWFAPFSPCEYNPWFLALMRKLLEGDPATLSLMRHNPFPDKPPCYVRASLYAYHFTTRAERKETGAYWKRSFRGMYCGTLSLADFR